MHYAYTDMTGKPVCEQRVEKSGGSTDHRRERSEPKLRRYQPPEFRRQGSPANFAWIASKFASTPPTSRSVPGGYEPAGEASTDHTRPGFPHDSQQRRYVSEGVNPLLPPAPEGLCSLTHTLITVRRSRLGGKRRLKTRGRGMYPCCFPHPVRVCEKN